MLAVAVVLLTLAGAAAATADADARRAGHARPHADGHQAPPARDSSRPHARSSRRSAPAPRAGRRPREGAGRSDRRQASKPSGRGPAIAGRPAARREARRPADSAGSGRARRAAPRRRRGGAATPVPKPHHAESTATSAARSASSSAGAATARPADVRALRASSSWTGGERARASAPRVVAIPAGPLPRIAARAPLPWDASPVAGLGARTTPETGSSPAGASAAPEAFLPFHPLVDPLARVVEVIPRAVWLALAGLAVLCLLFLGIAAWAAARARRAGRLARRAEREAVTDPLTGLLNRRGLEARLVEELERARRYGRCLSVAYVDVVGLKSVNDGHGHGSGDAVLAHVASALRAGSRDGDLVARVGGDEFAVALIEQDHAGAERFARRLRRHAMVARADLGLDAAWDVTVGIAAFPEDGEACGELLAIADRRLYAQRGIDVGPEPAPRPTSQRPARAAA